MASSTQPTGKAPDPLIGRTLADRFHITDRIATGGMGLVYKAEQLPLGREVAIKVLESKHVPDIDDTFRARFFLEAAAAAKLHHPNTIVVYDYGQAEDGMYFIAMEYIPGSTLERRLKTKGPLTPAQSVHVGLQICSSLRDAHEKGLIHRDLKPGNVMFAPRAGDSFFVKVLDFGLVKVVSGDEKDAAGLTQSGVVMGSPRYMAPEQVRSEAVDARTDIYSFGAVLYHMLAGAPPFAGGKAFDAMTAHVTTPPPSLTTTWPACPAGPRLTALVMRCLEKRPAARFQSMEELMTELHACVEEAGGAPTTSSNYMAHLSLPGLQLAAEKGDSDPRLQGPPSRGTWPGSDSSPNASGPRLVSPEVAPPGDVPVDVDLSGSMSGSHSPRPWTRWAALGALLVIGAGTGMGIALLPGGDEEPERRAQRTAPTPPVSTPAPSTEESPEPVRIVSIPPGATITYQGRDLGDTPVAVPVPSGESWEIELTLHGHQSRRVTVLAGQPQITVRLRPTPQPAPVAEQEEEEERDPVAERRRRIAAQRAQNNPPPATTQEPPRPAQQQQDDHPDLHDPWD